jgi:hypothetical protein
VVGESEGKQSYRPSLKYASGFNNPCSTIRRSGYKGQLCIDSSEETVRLICSDIKGPEAWESLCPRFLRGESSWVN